MLLKPLPKDLNELRKTIISSNPSRPTSRGSKVLQSSKKLKETHSHAHQAY